MSDPDTDRPPGVPMTPAAVIELPDPLSWAQLVAELRRAAEIDQNEAPETELPGHSAAWVALHGLYKFLLQQRVFQADPSPVAPLARLYGAMIDLRHGHVSKMFKPKRHNGRPTNDMIYETIKATTALAMTKLMRSGMSKPAAARAVAKAYRSRHGRRITWQTVAGWRDTLEAGEGPGAPKDGAALFAYGKPSMPLGDTDRQQADGLIEALRSSASRLT
jgi:hypothetical protein